MKREPMDRTAEISPCTRYRYTLTRRWADGPSVLFVMVNPSVADANDDDQTIRKCIGFSKRWGYSAFEAVNLYAFRATEIRNLWTADDPVGPKNDCHIEAARDRASAIVCAWGPKPKAWRRSLEVMRLLAAPSEISPGGRQLLCINVSQVDRHLRRMPLHPLVLGYTDAPVNLPADALPPELSR